MTKWDHGGGCEGVSCCFKCVRVFIRLAAVALPTADTPKMFQSEVDQRNHHKKKIHKKRNHDQNISFNTKGGMHVLSFFSSQCRLI